MGTIWSWRSRSWSDLDLQDQIILMIWSWSWTGAYLGGALCYGSLLWVARTANLHRKVSRIEAWPPLCKLGIRFDHTKAMFECFFLALGEKSDQIWVKTFFFLLFTWFFRENSDQIWVKTFFFALHLILGENSDWAGQFDSELCSSHIFWTFWPPPFQNLAYSTDLEDHIFCVILILKIRITFIFKYRVG